MPDAPIDIPAILELCAAATGLSGYAVTTEGDVWSVASNWRGIGPRKLVPILHKGYLSVRLVASDGRRIRRPVHRLVAEIYLPRIASGYQEVRHLNGNPLDNRSSNLAWGTQAENAADRESHHRTAKGDRNGTRTRPDRRPCGDRNGMRLYRERSSGAKLTPEQRVDVRKRLNSGESQSSIARSLGVSSGTICRLAGGKSWTN